MCNFSNLLIYRYYKKLIELRHTEAILTEGDYQLLLPESKEIFAYLRTTEEEQWLVAANLSEKEAETEQLLMYGKERQEIKIKQCKTAIFSPDRQTAVKYGKI